MSLILTRPAPANRRFVDQLPETLRAQVTLMHSPLIEIVPVEANLTIGLTDAVIFTSANAVRFAPESKGRRAFCVGKTTTAAAHDTGWQAIFAGETAEALVVFLQAYPLSSQVWHLAGQNTRGQVAERLTAKGMRVSRVTVYDQVFASLTPESCATLIGADPVLVPLFSPRTATRFAEECPKNAQPFVAALSHAVAEPLAHLPLKALEIAGRPTATAMVLCLEKLMSRVSLG